MSGPVAGNQVDVEGNDLSRRVNLQLARVVLVLISAAGIGVAIVARVGGSNSDLNRSGDVYFAQQVLEH